ncbi:MAG: hypothetical protein ABIE07_10985 [Candidatus Zixiibacteriota bacterium]
MSNTLSGFPTRFALRGFALGNDTAGKLVDSNPTKLINFQSHSSKFRESETQAGIHGAIEEMLNLSYVKYAVWIPDSLRPLRGFALGNDTGKGLLLAVARMTKML